MRWEGDAPAIQASAACTLYNTVNDNNHYTEETHHSKKSVGVSAVHGPRQYKPRLEEHPSVKDGRSFKEDESFARRAGQGYTPTLIGLRPISDRVTSLEDSHGDSVNQLTKPRPWKCKK